MEKYDTASRVRREMELATRPSERIDGLSSFNTDTSEHAHQRTRSMSASHNTIHAQVSYPDIFSRPGSHRSNQSMYTRDIPIHSTTASPQIGWRVAPASSLPISHSRNSLRSRMSEDVILTPLDTRKRTRESFDADIVSRYQTTSPPTKRSSTRHAPSLRQRYRCSAGESKATYTERVSRNDGQSSSQKAQERSVGPAIVSGTSHTKPRILPSVIHQAEEMFTEGPRLSQQTVEPRLSLPPMQHTAGDHTINVSDFSFELGEKAASQSARFGTQARRVEPLPIKPINFLAGKRHGRKARHWNSEVSCQNRASCKPETAYIPSTRTEDMPIRSTSSPRTTSVTQHVSTSQMGSAEVLRNDKRATPTIINGGNLTVPSGIDHELAVSLDTPRRATNEVTMATETSSSEIHDRLDLFMAAMEQKFSDFAKSTVKAAENKEVAYESMNKMLSSLSKDVKSISTHSQDKYKTPCASPPVYRSRRKHSTNVRSGEVTKQDILDKAEAVIQRQTTENRRKLDREYRSVMETAGHDYDEAGAKAYIEQGLKKWVETTRKKAVRKADARVLALDATLDITHVVQSESSVNAMTNPSTSAVLDQYNMNPMRQKLEIVSNLNDNSGFQEASSMRLNNRLESASDRESSEENDDDESQSSTKQDPKVNSARMTSNDLGDWQRDDGAPTIDDSVVVSRASVFLDSGCDQLGVVQTDMSPPGTQMINDYSVKRCTRMQHTENEAIVLRSFRDLDEANRFAQQELSKVRWGHGIAYTSRMDNFNARGHFTGKIILDVQPVRAEHVWVSCKIRYTGDLEDFSLREMKTVLPRIIYVVEVTTRILDNSKATHTFGAYSVLDLANKAAADHITELMRPKTDNEFELAQFETSLQELRGVLQQSYDEELPLDISHDDKDGQLEFQVEVKEMTVQGPLN